MKLKEFKDGFIGSILIIFSVAIVFTFIIFSVAAYNDDKIIEYCKEKGWDGVIDKFTNTKFQETVCYKSIPHESGTGNYREYSGDISGELE